MFIRTFVREILSSIKYYIFHSEMFHNLNCYYLLCMYSNNIEHAVEEESGNVDLVVRSNVVPVQSDGQLIYSSILFDICCIRSHVGDLLKTLVT